MQIISLQQISNDEPPSFPSLHTNPPKVSFELYDTIKTSQPLVLMMVITGIWWSTYTLPILMLTCQPFQNHNVFIFLSINGLASRSNAGPKKYFYTKIYVLTLTFKLVQDGRTKSYPLNEIQQGDSFNFPDWSQNAINCSTILK